METKSSFVRADGGVELHAVTKVGLHIALVVNPCDAEGKDTVGFDHSLNDLGLFKLGVLIIHLFD